MRCVNLQGTYGFEADTDWNKYLEEYARKIRNPLAVAIK